MTIHEMTSILRGEVKLYESPEEVQSKLNEIADALEAAIKDIKAMAKRLNSPCHWCKNAFADDPCNCLECDVNKCNENFEWRGVPHD